MTVTGNLNTLYSEIIEKRSKGKGVCICPNKSSDICNFRKTKESCWWPFIGDEKSKCIIVAEAPSAGSKKGKGVHFSRLLDEVVAVPPEKRKTWDRFYFAMKDTLGYYPHFTDAVKCGVSDQRRKDKNEILHRRFTDPEIGEDRCSYYLMEEIRIVNPSLVITVGWFAKQKIEEIKEKTGVSFDHKNILHYSGQASLPVNMDDKIGIIWPHQLKEHLPKGASLPDVSKLSFFNKD